MEQWKFKPARDLNIPPSQRSRSLQREVGLAGHLLHLLWWSLARIYLAVFHRLKITGREHLPANAPFVLVANHTSHLDAISLGAMLPRRLRGCVFPVAAGDTFFETSMAAHFAANVLNALPMWRKNCGRHAMQELRNRLIEEPCAYILFPEGTRSRTGEMTQFKAGLGMIVAGLIVPVIPCYIEGAFKAWPPDQRRPGPGCISISIGKPLCFENIENSRDGWNLIAESMQRAVANLVTET